MKPTLIAAAAALFLVVPACFLLERAATYRARAAAFEPERLPWTLAHMSELFPTRTVSRAGRIHELPRALRDLSVLDWTLAGETRRFDAFFEDNHTRGLVVLQGGRLVFERYAEGVDEATRFTSWSVAKSFTSTLVGLALKGGHLSSLDDPLERYVPALAGTAYEGVTIRQALQMSSGVRFAEEYTDGTDIYDYMLDTLFSQRKRANQAALQYPRGAEPGSVWNYNTAETQVLGWLLREATGRSPSAFLEETLWRRLGMEHDATWILDLEGPDGMEMTGCCLNMALRDQARFGQLFLQDGAWEGARILPEGWVAEATVPTSDHLRFGAEGEPPSWGYGYQWWWLGGRRFAAEGVHGQFIYVDPERELVIAKASAWPEEWDDALEAEARAAFQAIAASLADGGGG